MSTMPGKEWEIAAASSIPSTSRRPSVLDMVMLLLSVAGLALAGYRRAKAGHATLAHLIG
jgi:hypothetical protein